MADGQAAPAPAQQPAAPQAPQFEPGVPVTDEHSAALSLGRFLDPEPPQADPNAARDERGRFVPRQPQGEPDDPQAQAAEQAPEGEPAAEPEAEPAATVEIDPEAPLFEVKHGEEAKKVSLKELQSGYMMQADYTKKTQELAQVRKQTAQATEQAVAAERTQYLQTLGHLNALVQQAAAPELQQVDWNRLASESPADYVRLDNRRKQVEFTLNRLTEEAQRLTQKQEQEREQRWSQAVSESREVLNGKIPSWTDELYGTLLKRGMQTYGYTPEDITGQSRKDTFISPAFIEMLHDAHQYRLLKEGKPAVEKKVAEVPKAIKPGARQPVQAPQQQEFQKARQALRSSGRVEDAASVFQSFVGGTPRR